MLRYYYAALEDLADGDHTFISSPIIILEHRKNKWLQSGIKYYFTTNVSWSNVNLVISLGFHCTLISDLQIGRMYYLLWSLLIYRCKSLYIHTCAPTYLARTHPTLVYKRSSDNFWLPNEPRLKVPEWWLLLAQFWIFIGEYDKVLKPWLTNETMIDSRNKVPKLQ